jgi:hypothetical protein
MDGKMIVLAKKLLPPDDRLGNLWATSHRRAPEAAICFVGTICANLRLD